MFPKGQAVHISLAENQHMVSPNKDIIEKKTKKAKNNEWKCK